MMLYNMVHFLHCYIYSGIPGEQHSPSWKDFRHGAANCWDIYSAQFGRYVMLNVMLCNVMDYSESFDHKCHPAPDCFVFKIHIADNLICAHFVVGKYKLGKWCPLFMEQAIIWGIVLSVLPIDKAWLNRWYWLITSYFVYVSCQQCYELAITTGALPTTKIEPRKLVSAFDSWLCSQQKTDCAPRLSNNNNIYWQEH